MISCSEAVRQLWDYLEQGLDATDRAQVEQHVALCRRCCGEMEFAEALREFLCSAAHPVVPEAVETRLVGFLETLEREAT